MYIYIYMICASYALYMRNSLQIFPEIRTSSQIPVSQVSRASCHLQSLPPGQSWQTDATWFTD